MAADTQDPWKIIESLYEAALDPALWRGMAPRLARLLSASSAVIKLQAPHGLELVDTTENFEGETRDEALAEHWHRNDLWVERSAAYGFGRVVVGHELTPFEELEETGYYLDWLSPLAIRDMVGGVVKVGESVGVLGVHRAPGEAAFGFSERTTVQILLPHLERAFRIWARLSNAEARTGLAALEQSPQAVIVVGGPGRRVVFLNAAAERLLSRGGGLAVRAGRLAAGDPAAQARLDRAVAYALENGRGAIRPPPTPIALPRPETGPLIVSAAPLPEWLAPNGEPAVLVMLREIRPVRPEPHLMRTAFGLTRAEAAVASALCVGLSLPSIAAELGIGLATVRSHLKSVMQKTQTNRQAELVALLSALSTASDL